MAEIKDNGKVLHYAPLMMIWLAATAVLCFLLTKNAVEWEFGKNVSPPEWCSAGAIQLFYCAGLLGIIYILTGFAAGLTLVICRITRLPNRFFKAFCLTNTAFGAIALLAAWLLSGPAFSS